MSSFRAEISVDNQTFALTRVYFEMRRHMDERGRPMALPVWTVWINMNSTDNTTITSWMVDPKKTLDVKITFYQTDQDTKYREIKLDKAYCYYLHEMFSSDGQNGLTRFEVIGNGVTIGATSYFNG